MRLLALLAVACVPVTPSGDVLAPARVAPTAAPAPADGEAPTEAPPAPDGGKAPVRAKGPQGDFDFDADDRDGEPAADDGTADAGDDPLALQARLLGLDEVPEAKPAPTVVPTGPQAPVWDPTHPLPDSGFGVRVLAVLLDMQPPRAVLGLPDGREQVVTPGAMLPAEGLVVLAIGRDAVQVAKITPSGFYARVETQTVQALYPQPAPARP